MNGSRSITTISAARSRPAPKARRARHAGSIWAPRIGAAREFNDWCQRVFERFDLLLCPVLPTEAFPAKGPMPTEINGQPLKEPLNAVVFTYPFNMSGHPGRVGARGPHRLGAAVRLANRRGASSRRSRPAGVVRIRTSAPVEQQVASDLIHDDPVGVALELLPLIRAHADETERERRLAAPVVDAMRAGGLFSMGVPAALGGLETPLAQVLRGDRGSQLRRRRIGMEHNDRVRRRLAGGPSQCGQSAPAGCFDSARDHRGRRGSRPDGADRRWLSADGTMALRQRMSASRRLHRGRDADRKRRAGDGRQRNPRDDRSRAARR